MKILLISLLYMLNLLSYELPTFDFDFNQKEEKQIIKKTEIEKQCNFPMIPETKDIKSDEFKMFEIEFKSLNECVSDFLNEQLDIYKMTTNKNKKESIVLNVKQTKEFLYKYNNNVQNYRESALYVYKKSQIDLSDKNRLKEGKSRNPQPSYY